MDILAELKTQTWPIHQELEKISLLKKLISKEIELPEYKKLLCIFYGFIYPYENKIKMTNSDLLINREKSPLLRADLATFEQLNLEELSFCQVTTCLNREAEIYGYLYVMEGATLGGQVINKALKANSKLSSQISTHYFNAYDHETRRNWRDFSLDLCKKNVTNTQKTQVITTAIETFTALFYWLNRNIPNDL
jgi:heme oxygenase (biliverdin-IX-beta and delta-forming)